jgi:site-specific recombinase XerD
MTEHAVQILLRRIGERAGAEDVHPHRFRHTFAIQYLRNGGDIYSLRTLMGHATLAMVMHYLDLAQTDVAQAHRQASPGDRWR